MIATYKAKLFINHDKAQSDTLKLIPGILRLMSSSCAGPPRTQECPADTKYDGSNSLASAPSTPVVILRRLLRWSRRRDNDLSPHDG